MLALQGTHRKTKEEHCVLVCIPSRSYVEHLHLRQLQLLVCLMHASKLIQKKLMEVVDGKTTSPRTAEGQIPDLLEFDSQQKPIIEFSPVSGCVAELEDTMMNDLSTDQL